MSGRGPLPRWVDYGLLPLAQLALAIVLSGMVVLLVGESPLKAARLLIAGAFGSGEATGYTLYYATNFVFTGLAVAVAFHAGLFNCGGEGQAGLGGLGVTLAALWCGHSHPLLAIPACILAATLFGGFWGFVPGWLQAHRRSHIVITTILLNFVAASIQSYLLGSVLIRSGQLAPETITLDENVWIPQLHELLGPKGLAIGRSPLNLAALLALLCALLVWVYVWKTRSGYELRVVGQSEVAASYAGIPAGRHRVLVMTISGGLAGLMAVNEVLGAQHRLVPGFTGGYGFVGIAVAFLGRNHPLGVVLAALLFGALYQGGAALAFDMPGLSRDMIVVIQGLVIFFAGALEPMFRPTLERLFAYGAGNAR